MQLGEASSLWTRALSQLSVTDLEKLQAICVGSIVGMLSAASQRLRLGWGLPSQGGGICLSE